MLNTFGMVGAEGKTRKKRSGQGGWEEVGHTPPSWQKKGGRGGKKGFRGNYFF